MAAEYNNVQHVQREQYNIVILPFGTKLLHQQKTIFKVNALETGLFYQERDSLREASFNLNPDFYYISIWDVNE